MLLYVFYAVLMLRYSYTVRWICREKELVSTTTVSAEESPRPKFSKMFRPDRVMQHHGRSSTAVVEDRVLRVEVVGWSTRCFNLLLLPTPIKSHYTVRAKEGPPSSCVAL